MSIHKTERDLAAYFLLNPNAERLPSTSFYDPMARAAVETIEEMEATGIPITPTAFPSEIQKRDRLPAEAGEICAEILGSEAESWTPGIAETAFQAVKDAADRRDVEHGLRVAVAKLEKGERIEDVLAVIPNRQDQPAALIEDDHDNPPEPCPIQALDGLIAGDMAREAARFAAVPDALAVASVLGVASGAIGAGLRVSTWAGDTGANLYVCAVARSGTGKDRCLNLVAAPIHSLEAKRIEAWRTDTVPDLEADLRIVKAEIAELEKAIKAKPEPETKQAIKKAERRRAEIEEDLASEPCLTIGDVTKEALGVALSRQPGEAAFAISSEARGIFNVIAGRYSGDGDEDLWCSGFSRTPVKVNRTGRKTVALNGPCIAALLMVQPDAFRRAADRPEMAESGFLARFIPFDAKARPQKVRDQVAPVDHVIASQWAALIVKLVETFRDKGGEPVVINMEPEAEALLRAYANEIVERRETDLADLDAFAARWAEIACRIALVLHAIEHGPEVASRPISSVTATRAYLLMEWFSREAVALLGDLAENRKRERRERLRSLLDGADNSEMTLRDLDRRHGFAREDVERIIPKIGGRIETRKGDRGRPSLVAKLTKAPKP